MKVYVGVDSEGQACVTREAGSDGVYGTFQAEFIRRQATAEAAAAVHGAREAGATDIVVHDAGFIRGATPVGLTLLYDDLPRGIRIALGGAPLKEVAAEGFDAALLIGCHAMAGAPGGVLAHTFSSVTVKEMILNGRPIGEIGIEALQLGVFDIPVAMVSGDRAACDEAIDWLGNVEVAPVKKGFSAHSAVSVHPADACDLIRSAVKRALARLGDFTPFKMAPPFELRVHCFTSEQADARARKAGGERVEPAGCVVRTEDPLELH